MCRSSDGGHDEKDFVPPSKRCGWWLNICSFYLSRKRESDWDTRGDEEGDSEAEEEIEDGLVDLETEGQKSE
jgi:hypothetical protein